MQDLKEFADSPSETAKNELLDALELAIASAHPDSKIDREQLELSLSTPEPALGDLSSSIAFKLAKIAKRDPKEIAKEIAGKMKATKYIAKFADANGYVNAFFDEKKYAALVIRKVMQDKSSYGSSKMGKGAKVIVEFPSVNPVKPWHVGHLRSALLGDTVSNIMEHCDYVVEREDYIDDLGLQVAETLWAYLRTDGKPDKKFDLWLGEQYVKISAEAKEKAQEIGEVLKKMEGGGNDIASKAREITEMAVKAQYETAFSYNIYHDVLMWESDIVKAKLLDSALGEVKKKGVAEIEKSGDYEDCLVVKLEKVKNMAKEFENPKENVKVLVRSNGVATYAAKDLAFHMWKFGLMDKKFNYKRFIEKQPNGKPLYSTSQTGEKMDFGGATMIVNTIDSSQSPEQQIVKAMLYLMGYKGQSEEYLHLAYGKVAIESGALKGRSGNWLGDEKNFTADDLLRETTQKALGIVSNSKKVSKKENTEEIARSIALSAIKFEYLRIAPEKAFTFSWESALNFEANSGPYVMYTYARANKILKMAGYKDAEPKATELAKITRGVDFELVKRIGMAREILEKACIETRPNTLTDYLLELSSLFSKFYESMPVMKGGEAKNLRLAIVYSLTVLLDNMLRLLGIAPVQEM